MKLRRSTQSERGQGLIEFAIVFPLFVFFLFAVFEVGLGLNRQATLQHAVREGARAGAVLDNTDTAPIVDRTIAQSQGLLAPGDVQVTYDDLGVEGCAVNVKANYVFRTSILSPVLRLVSAGTTTLADIPINVTGSARVERKLTNSC